MKKFCFLLIVLMVFNIIIPSIASARSVNTNEKYLNIEELTNLSEEEQVEYWAKSFKLYFSEIGHIKKNGQYVIDNPERLLQEVQKGDEGAKQLYDLYIESKQNKSVDAFLKCVISDQFSWLISFIKGDMIDGLGNALATGAWTAAGKIMSTAISEASKIAGKTVGWVYTGASVALSMYNCRHKW